MATRPVCPASLRRAEVGDAGTIDGSPDPDRHVMLQRWITRRRVLNGLAGLGAASVPLGGYAVAIEPMWLRITHYRISPPGWPEGFKLELAVVADIHAGEPQMSIGRVEEIVTQTNALGADAILLLGDYEAGHKLQTRRIPAREWAAPLAGLAAPLGVHAVLGNHDWWDDLEAQGRQSGPVRGRIELERVGIPVYENDVVRLEKQGQGFWLAGLGDQIALWTSRRNGRSRYLGVDDLEGTIGKVTDDAPIVLMAHEPDIFPRVPDRVAVTISGHTHGGQVRMFGWAPIVPSRYGDRFAYGHIVETGRHLVVSGGLGCSIAPVRLGCMPEILRLTLVA